METSVVASSPPVAVWLAPLLDRLAAAPIGGYQARSPAWTEPTALAALALLAWRLEQAAHAPLVWLRDAQQPDGSLGVGPQEPSPGWPTSLAVLAWNAALRLRPDAPWRAALQRGIAWIERTKGEVLPRGAATAHDSTLVGWPWIEGTHSWVEPTALAALALQATGHPGHPRAQEARRLLADRELPAGGWNYGNTLVLGQELRPHLLPTGLALLALAPQGGRPVSRQWLHEQLAAAAPFSLGYGLLALQAQGAAAPEATNWLRQAADRWLRRPTNLAAGALLALAAAGPSVFLPPPNEDSAP